MPNARDFYAGQISGFRTPRRTTRPARSPSSLGSFTVFPKKKEEEKEEELDYTRWWETPGATFRTVAGRGGKGVRQVMLPGSNRWIDATLPDQFAGQFPDSESFYNLFQSAGPLGVFLTANASSAETAADAAAADVQRALTGLGGVRTQYGNALTTFRDDPNAARVQSELERRTRPDYRAVSEIEESAVINELAQNVARATDAALSNAGFRGVSAAPGTGQRVSSIGALGEAAGLGIRRDIASENRRAQDTALGQLEEFRRGRQAGELALLGALGDIERQIAAVQTGQQYVPTDYFPLAELQFGQEQFRTGQEFADRALTTEEEAVRRAQDAAEPDFWDWLANIGSLAGTGAFEGDPRAWAQWARLFGLG